MSFLLTAGIIAGVSALASLVGSAINSAEQEKTNEANIKMNEANNQLQMDLNRETMAFNSAEAQKQRDWETEMSNTAYQRKAADLQAAGINPLLALEGGAAVPSGASASATTARTQASQTENVNWGSGLQSLASFAQSAAMIMALSKISAFKSSSQSQKYDFSRYSRH